MPVVRILHGLPASGKTTYAKQLEFEGWVRVNKDDLRRELPGRSEKDVIAEADLRTAHALSAGRNVVDDNTNINPWHRTRIEALALKHGSTVEMKYFDTDVDECISRDAQRANPVGEAVIRKMEKDRRKTQVDRARQPVPPPAHVAGAQDVVLVDMDGTYALIPEGANVYDRDFLKDILSKPVHAVLAGLHLPVIVVSGRSSRHRAQTEAWLSQHECPYLHLFMRPENDNRNDAEVKRDLYEEHIKGKYNVFLVLDDRNRVVDLWRSLGLVCFQVAPGDF